MIPVTHSVSRRTKTKKKKKGAVALVSTAAHSGEIISAPRDGRAADAGEGGGGVWPEKS